MKTQPRKSKACKTEMRPRFAFTLIVPAYNESSGIGYTLEEFQKIFKSAPCEIIVIDDGSSDNTSSIAESCGVKVLKHAKNQGYGSALKTGIKNATHNNICITDADGTYPAECIPTLLQEMINKNYDMVVGVRTGEKVVMEKSRRLVKWALRKIAGMVIKDKIPDLNSGLRTFKKESVLNFINILPNGFSFTTTITLGMLVNDYAVHYVPIDYHPRKGKSKIRPIYDTLNFIKLILRIGLYFAPLKIFLPLSGIFLFLAIAWGLISTLLLHKFADASTLIIFMTGIQIAVIGLLAELINHRTQNSYRKK